MRISQNITGTHVNRLFSVNTRRTEKSIERLTLGTRINRAVDDSSGLAISEKMRGQIRGFKQGLRNAQDGISLIQTAEGALVETHEILHRMRDLAVQSSHDMYIPQDRTTIQNELELLATEITRIATHTEFNTKTVLDGSFEDFNLNISLGIGNSIINFNIKEMTASELGLSSTASGKIVLDDRTEAFYKNYEIEAENGSLRYPLDIQSAEKASADITVIDQAIGKVSSERTNLGAVQNQLESAINNLGVSIENLQASESRYRDLDMPSEVMNLARNQILGSSITMMLAHATIDPKSIVPLLVQELKRS